MRSSERVVEGLLPCIHLYCGRRCLRLIWKIVCVIWCRAVPLFLGCFMWKFQSNVCDEEGSTAINMRFWCRLLLLLVPYSPTRQCPSHQPKIPSFSLMHLEPGHPPFRATHSSESDRHARLVSSDRGDFGMLPGLRYCDLSPMRLQSPTAHCR